MKKLTVIFYQYPSALKEIGNWEKSKKHQILTKTQEQKNIQYVLSDEIVYCLPINSESIEKVLSIQNVKYEKTLIFGKVLESDLVKILDYMQKIKIEKMSQRIIHIDGVDKTGKDTIRNLIVKNSKGCILVIVRSYLSQIVYSRIYNRNIDENFFFDKMLNDFNSGIEFFVFECDYKIAEKRFLLHNEKDLELQDFENHKSVFRKVVRDARLKGIGIKIINTSLKTPLETLKEIL